MAPPTPQYRFTPIEAPSTSSRRRVNGKAQPAAAGASFSFYPSQPPAASSHYNPPAAAHPYFFPPTLAHQPAAHLPTGTPTPASNLAATAPNGLSAPTTSSTSTPKPIVIPPAAPPPPDPNVTTDLTTYAPSNSSSSSSSSSVSPSTSPTIPKSKSKSKSKKKKEPNPASRPTTHPNPFGLTRISPPPECNYPNADIAATVIHAWSTSRNFKVSRQKSDKNAKGDIYKQYYLCSRHGRPTNTHKVTEETRQRKQRKSERIGCPMGIVVRAVEAGNVSGDWCVRWQLEGKSEWHNHGPATEEEVKAEEDRKTRNERRKAARGTGNGKRGRRPKDPDGPKRKRIRRRKGAVLGGIGGEEVGEGPGPGGIGGDEAERQLQREMGVGMGDPGILTQEGVGGGYDHGMGGQLGASQHQQLGQHQHQHQQQHGQQHQQQHQQQHHHGQPDDMSSRPLPSLWGLNDNLRGPRLEQEPYRGFGRSSGGMVYAPNQVYR